MFCGVSELRKVCLALQHIQIVFFFPIYTHDFVNVYRSHSLLLFLTKLLSYDCDYFWFQKQLGVFHDILHLFTKNKNIQNNYKFVSYMKL